jgi:hypothetical protein
MRTLNSYSRPQLLAIAALTFLAALAVATLPAQAEEPYQIVWTQQLIGGFDLTLDRLGNFHFAGSVWSAVSPDAIAYKYDAEANLAWSRQIGTSSYDEGRGVGVDASGNVYLGGVTGGSLAAPGGNNEDAFLIKYNSLGDFQWSRQLGATEPDAYAAVEDVTANADSGAWLTGYTNGSVGGPHVGGINNLFGDAFLLKYDAEGNLAWSRQLGTTSDDWGHGVAADSLGNAYVTGITFGNLARANNGYRDVFLAKYDSAGSRQWTRQLGTSTDDFGLGITGDGLGNLFVAGETLGSLGGTNPDGAGNPQGSDPFLAKYDATGNLLWTRQVTLAGQQNCRYVAADAVATPISTGGTPAVGARF